MHGPPRRGRSMADRYGVLAGVLALLLLVGASDALVSSQPLKPSFPRAISDLKEAVVKGLGTQAEGVELLGFDPDDAMVGQSVAYEFHVEIDKKVVPIKLLEDVSQWEFKDLPFFGADGDVVEEEEKGLAEMGKVPESKVLPVLPPFQVAGPMELWIQDGDDMRLSLPHEVDAGVLKKVVLSDGAVVTVKGVKSVSLRHPVKLPLPLNRTSGGHSVASGLLTMAEALLQASRSNERPLLSLRIVGPTSLTSSSSSMSPRDRLKLKRLAPGLVELSSPSLPALSEEIEGSNAPILWPLTSLNGSDSKLRGFEELLASVLGEKGREEGSFRLLKVEVSARTCVKLGFTMVKQILDGEVDWSSFPSWMSKPERVRSHFEVLAVVEENGKIVPERIAEVEPVPVQVVTVLESVRTGNLTMSRLPIYHPPPVYFTL